MNGRRQGSQRLVACAFVFAGMASIGCDSGAGQGLDAGSSFDAGLEDLYVFDLPATYPRPLIPTDNPMTRQKVELGRYLFYDTRLSWNETQSCATCHQQARAFTDGREMALGSTGEAHFRNSMSLSNVAYVSAFTWASRIVGSLEAQALIPMFGEAPVELGLAGRELALFERLRADPRYLRLFAEAFPGAADPFTVQNIARAIASFERSLVSHRSPYDRFVYGMDRTALSPEATRGLSLFFDEKFECFHCHGGFNFSDSTRHDGTVFDETTFHNTGLYNVDGRGGYPLEDTGLERVTSNPADMGRFRAPTLRNIELTAPYMHDGSIATLEGVLDHYARGGRLIESGPNAGDGARNPLKSPFVRPIDMSPEERRDLLAFLRSLTDQAFVTDPALADPHL